MNIGIISQARMTSTRLPGKVLFPAAQKTMLHYHVERLQQSGYQVYIATTTNLSDLPIVAFCQQQKIPYTCGSEQNVLSRYHACAEQYGLELVVRVTSDCPLIDGQLIEEAIQIFLQKPHPYLYISNGIVRTFPRGFDFEVFTAAYLKEAQQNATLPMDIEHVTPYIHQNRNGKTIFHHFTQTPDKSRYRITLDTPEDYSLLKILIEEHHAHTLNHAQITQILDENPQLVQINAHVEQKKINE